MTGSRRDVALRTEFRSSPSPGTASPPVSSNHSFEARRCCGPHIIRNSIVLVASSRRAWSSFAARARTESAVFIEAVVDHQREVGNLGGRADGLLRQREPGFGGVQQPGRALHYELMEERAVVALVIVQLQSFQVDCDARRKVPPASSNSLQCSVLAPRPGLEARDLRINSPTTERGREPAPMLAFRGFAV